jgi:hypothetical protein
MRLVWATVGEVTSGAAAIQRLAVTRDDGVDARAVCYTTLAGTCATGDRVLLNTTATELALGTGGEDLVVARSATETPDEGVLVDDPSGGHIMKLRYAPLQRDVLAVEEEASPHHEVLLDADSLEGMPVVCCGLHSHLPAVAAALREIAPDARIAYVMTDEAALPLAMSDTVRACRDAGLVDTTISCGQAFGGELEAVNVYSGLLAARLAAGAAAAIVAIGPGVPGTGTLFGHGGVAQGETVNAVTALAGRPIAALRMSFADARPRHRSVSHHTLVALVHVALGRATVAVPNLRPQWATTMEEQLEEAGVWARHDRADSERYPEELPDTRGVALCTMGRDAEADPAFFAAAATAGEVAGRLLRPAVPDEA